jgi:hypothetical protein
MAGVAYKLDAVRVRDSRASDDESVVEAGLGLNVPDESASRSGLCVKSRP